MEKAADAQCAGRKDGATGFRYAKREVKRVASGTALQTFADDNLIAADARFRRGHFVESVADGIDR